MMRNDVGNFIRELRTEKRPLRHALTAIFLLIVFAVPVYWLTCPETKNLELEKRYAAEWPTFSWEKLANGKWGKGVEDWMADQMPLRSFFVATNSYANLATGRQSARDILVTRDGYLVEAPVELNEASLGKNLAAISAFADAVDADVSLMLVPSTGYVSGNALPGYIASEYTEDTLFPMAAAALEGHASFIDLRGDFRAGGASLFYKTDRHWNAQGVYTAYLTAAKALGFSPLDKTAFDVVSWNGFLGTTLSESGLYLHPADAIELWYPPCEVSVSFSDKEGVYDSLFFTEYESAYDKYPVYLDSNHPLTVVENKSVANGGTLVLVKDSYGNSLVPLLINHYERIIMVDMRYYKQEVSALAAEYGADDVLILYSAENIVVETNIVWLR